VLRGREEFRAFYREVARRKSNVIRPRHHGNYYFIDARRIVWEYPRVTPSGEQSEFMESWEFNEEYEIRFHRVYWGWSRIASLTQNGFSPAQG
jgi:hypothetical protein